MTSVLANLYLPDTRWVWPVAGAGLVALLLLVWGYRRAAAGLSVRWAAGGLKALAMALVLLCVLEPSWIGQRATPGANLVLVVADNSRGLNISEGGGTSRADEVRRLLDTTGSDWLGSIAGDFQVRRYIFDSRVRRVNGYEALAFDGSRSDLMGALRTLADRYAGEPIAAIVVLTDGIATDDEASIGGLAGLPPVHAVPIGRDRPARDVAIGDVSVSQSVFEDAPVQVRAAVRASGLGGSRVYVSLLDPDGKLVEQRPVRFSADDELMPVTFDLRPEHRGVAFYRLSVGLRPLEPDADTESGATTDADDPTAAADEAGEATLANNRRLLAVTRDEGPYRILYVSGRPNWEYKFLRRAIDQDEQIDLVGLIRIAKREPRFAWRGREGESSNPLFRGFDPNAQETAQEYDQPVLVGLNTRDAEELKGGFPVEAEALFGYHAVILDDVEAAFFTHEQMELLRRFASDRGGGVLMLGGAESFEYGGYQQTPIGQMMPIYINPPQADVVQDLVRWDLTREGRLQPWARLRATERDENDRLAEMAAFESSHRFRSIKPGASVISTIETMTGESHPALVVQRYGNGRTAALAVADFWRWGFHEPQQHPDLDRAWRQMLRYLVSDVPGRVTIEAEPDPELPAGGRRLRVRVRDASFEPVDFAELTMNVQMGDETIRLDAEPSLDEPGVFTADFVPRGSGGYRVEVAATDEDEQFIGAAETGWAVDHDADEFRSLTPNRALLEHIAAATGGELVEADDLGGFADRLPNAPAPITETHTQPVWHSPWVLAAALICLIGEWAVRRRRALP